MMLFALRLILAHLAGDFLFQPYKWVLDKEKKKHRSPYLYLHIFVHLLLLIIVLSLDGTHWLALLIIPVHYVIDVVKAHLQERYDHRWLFVLDQLLHLSTIGFFVYYYFPFSMHSEVWLQSEIWLFVIYVVLMTKVSSILMKVFISKWSELPEFSHDSLPDAGAYIGMLERMFVFLFILTNHWEGIGFLLAAKSIFRYGDLSKAQDRKLTEYVLIGTFISFGLAMAGGLSYLYIVRGM